MSIKNILLIEPKLEKGFIAKFIVGRQRTTPFSGGFGLHWWYTETGFRVVENMAAMLTAPHTEFAACDIDTAGEVIKKTMQEICVDKRLFNPDDVCFLKKDTLFDCKSPREVDKIGEIIVEEISKRLRKSLANWCTAYVAPRITGETFHVPQLGINLINKKDSATWEKIVATKYWTNEWSPETGKFAMDDSPTFSRLKYELVFLVEEHGTQKGSKFLSQLKLRKLFAVIYAINSERSAHQLSKSAADPYTLCLQFPSRESSSLGITTSGIGELVPYYIDDVHLAVDFIAEVSSWFELSEELKEENFDRVEKRAHFINRAMNATDIESYVNYFIALDALFGKRGDVEDSITRGVNMLPGEQRWQEKISWLFELRNELVHGGSRHIKEWKRYYNYYHHFDSKPHVDIERLAFAALVKAPTILSKN